MRGYFKRLKRHPGVPVAGVYSALFFLAGCGNPNGYAGLYGAAVASACVWIMVLWTNRKGEQ